MDDRALGAVAGENGSVAGVAAFQGHFTDIEAVAALLLVRAMAVGAMLRKDGLDIGDKIHRAGRLRGGRVCGEQGGASETCDEERRKPSGGGGPGCGEHCAPCLAAVFRIGQSSVASATGGSAVRGRSPPRNDS
jgi:hypothetical protein